MSSDSRPTGPRVTVHEAAVRLDEIVAAVGQASEAAGRIAARAGGQAEGLARVQASLAEVDRVTQQNAASAEESSSAASELNAQAEELASMVATFTLEETEDGPVERRATLGPAPARRHHAFKALTHL